MNAYDLGDLAHITVAFTTSAGVATNPTAVNFKYKMADDLTWTTLVYGVDAALVRSSTGNYYVDVNCDAVGIAMYRWWSTGTGQAASQGEFLVYDSSVLALTLGQAKANLRVTSTDEDDRILALIGAAQTEYEDYTGRILLSSTQILYLDEFEDEKIYLKAPLVSITSIQYYDANNALQTLAAAQYVKDPYAENPYVELAYSCTWPTTYDRPGAVIITYIAGYSSAAAVPETVKNGLLLYIGHHFENREPQMIGQVATKINPWEACWSRRRVPV